MTSTGLADPAVASPEPGETPSQPSNTVDIGHVRAVSESLQAAFGGQDAATEEFMTGHEYGRGAACAARGARQTNRGHRGSFQSRGCFLMVGKARLTRGPWSILIVKQGRLEWRMSSPE